MTTTLIPVERLTHETWIAAPAGAARAIEITFDGSGYGIDLRYGESDDGYEEYLYVEAGGSVEFAGVGEPKLRGEQFVTKDEWQAKGDAISRATDELLGQINAAQGHVCQPVDETALVASVAAAVGVPALEAAE
jgi:hypothetical protein